MATGPSTVDIFRPDNLGDVVLFTGALRHIRDAFPEAEIRMWTQRYASALVELCPYIDSVLSWDDDLFARLPQFPGRSRMDPMWRSRRFRGYETDVLLVPMRAPTAPVLAAAAAVSARMKVGVVGDNLSQERYPAGSPRIFDIEVDAAQYGETVHDLTLTRDFVAALGRGVSIEDIQPELWTDEQDRLWAHAAVSGSSGAINLAIAPGVSSALRKQYPPERYAAIIDGLPDRLFSVYVFGAESEREVCGAVEQALRGCSNVAAVRNFAGRTTVRQLVEALRRCDVVLAVDTAALHIATAAGVPTVGIMGGAHLGRFYPWGDQGRNRVATHYLGCYGCNWDCPYSTTLCITGITPSVISAEVAALLQSNPPKR